MPITVRDLFGMLRGDERIVLSVSVYEGAFRFDVGRVTGDRRGDVSVKLSALCVDDAQTDLIDRAMVDAFAKLREGCP